VPLESFGDVIGEVLQYGFNDGPQVNRKRIENWINQAQSQIARQVEAPEFQETELLSLVKGQSRYALPANFLRTQDIYYPNLLTRLRMCDLQQFDQSGNFEGPPAMYTLYANELWLFPTPNQTGEEVEHRFIKNPPTLVNESDVPLLNKNYLHLLVDYAVERAYRAEDDSEMAASFKALWKEDLDAYATDVQDRFADRPRIIGGTWGEGSAATYIR
jgi:hypothetical protein